MPPPPVEAPVASAPEARATDESGSGPVLERPVDPWSDAPATTPEPTPVETPPEAIVAVP